MKKKRYNKKKNKSTRWLIFSLVVFLIYWGDSKYTNLIAPQIEHILSDLIEKSKVEEENIKGENDKLLTGKVVHVSDGDTVLLENDNGKRFKIRLNGIDAPEMGQEYGEESKDFVKKIVFYKLARVDVVGIDRYNRILGVLTVDGVDINKALLENGLAWQYRFNNNGEYQALVKQAKIDKKNIWSKPNSIDPYLWRKQKQ